MNLAQLIRYYELKLQGKEEVIQTTPNVAKETLKALYELYDYCIDDPTLDEIDMENVQEYNENVALNLPWQLVQQPVTWEEAIEAWVDGKKVSYSYMGYNKRFPFEDYNTMMRPEKIKNAEWYVED